MVGNRVCKSTQRLCACLGQGFSNDIGQSVMARCLASAQPERSAGERRVEKNELLGAVGCAFGDLVTKVGLGTGCGSISSQFNLTSAPLCDAASQREQLAASPRHHQKKPTRFIHSVL